jgi:hypothetical protein
LMAGNERIQFIAEAIISKCQNVPIQRWPDRGMNGSITRFKEILGVHEIAQRLEGTINTLINLPNGR